MTLTSEKLDQKTEKTCHSLLREEKQSAAKGCASFERTMRRVTFLKLRSLFYSLPLAFAQAILGTHPKKTASRGRQPSLVNPTEHITQYAVPHATPPPKVWTRRSLLVAIRVQEIVTSALPAMECFCCLPAVAESC